METVKEEKQKSKESGGDKKSLKVLDGKNVSSGKSVSRDAKSTGDVKSINVKSINEKNIDLHIRLIDDYLQKFGSATFRNLELPVNVIQRINNNLVVLNKAYEKYKKKLPNLSTQMDIQKYVAILLQKYNKPNPSLRDIQEYMKSTISESDGKEDAEIVQISKDLLVLDKYIDAVNAINAEDKDNVYPVKFQRIFMHEYDKLTMNMYELLSIFG